jgi:hypothetical protein
VETPLPSNSPTRGRELRLLPASVPSGRWQGSGNKRSPTPSFIGGLTATLRPPLQGSYLQRTRALLHLGLNSSLHVDGSSACHVAAYYGRSAALRTLVISPPRLRIRRRNAPESGCRTHQLDEECIPKSCADTYLVLP